MRRAWKMYEKCKNELNAGCGKDFLNGDTEGRMGSLKNSPKKV